MNVLFYRCLQQRCRVCGQFQPPQMFDTSSVVCEDCVGVRLMGAERWSRDPDALYDWLEDIEKDVFLLLQRQEHQTYEKFFWPGSDHEG